MLSSIDVKFIFETALLQEPRTVGVVQLRKYSPNNRCRPSNCLLSVLAIFLASLVPRRSLLIRCPREVWETASISR